jgi:ATP-dependent Clp protease ATP-binding subunit ClpB
MYSFHIFRDELTRVQGIKSKLEQARKDLEIAQRRGDLAQAGRLRYGLIPDLEKELPVEDENIGDVENEVIEVEEDGKPGKLLHESVTPKDVAAVISKSTGIPLTSMLRGDRDRLLHLEDELKTQIIGQDEAVSAVSNAVRLGRAGFNDPRRPIASFLFLGPTGVGKTELCKQMARVLFDSPTSVTRIDMSEYMEKHSVSRLIGAPPGYVGYEEGGQLTEAVRRRPYSVILFDEFEKAHRDVSLILLQVLDEGFLTDSQGVRVDFRNTIIIMTSNLGNDPMESASAASIDEILRRHLAPEFINRIDEIVQFNSLNKEQIRGIIEIRLKEISNRLKEEKRIELKISESVKNLLADEGFDQIYGARPLQRAIQKRILNPLAKKVIEGTIKTGQIVEITQENNEILFN